MGMLIANPADVSQIIPPAAAAPHMSVRTLQLSCLGSGNILSAALDLTLPYPALPKVLGTTL